MNPSVRQSAGERTCSRPLARRKPCCAERSLIMFARSTTEPPGSPVPSLIVVASSRVAADVAAQGLRREGFLARATSRGTTPLIIVDYASGEHALVKERVHRSDPGARLIAPAPSADS